MGKRVNSAGLVVAGTGFFLTRFTVTLAIYEEPIRFYLAGVVPLVLGLGLAAFGVALAVADVEASLVRTTALWCLVGTATMSVLAVLTLLGSTTGGLPDPAAVRTHAYVSNFLIGGAVGGTLTGLYAAHNRRHRRELRRQANRLKVLNRLLRHEVLNSVTVVRGYADLIGDADGRAKPAIEKHAVAIERTIEDVKHLTRGVGDRAAVGESVSLSACLDESVAAVTGRYPEATVSVGTVPDELSVRATDRLVEALDHLLENAVVHSPDAEPTVEVTVAVAGDRVRISVADDGSGLPESQQALLETGEIGRYDDPGMGFGLNVVRLLVESFRGSIETDVGPEGTTVTVVLPRTDSDGTRTGPIPTDLNHVSPALPHLAVTLVAAVIAGVFYGVAAEQLGGSVGIIGVFYGVESTVVGWITHEFHSIVFGFAFAGLVSLAPARYRDHTPAYVLIGIAWGLVLWFVAAGIVSSIWLRLLGIPAPIPSLSHVTLVSHLVWGVSLGALTAFGYEHVTPWMDQVAERSLGRLRSA